MNFKKEMNLYSYSVLIGIASAFLFGLATPVCKSLIAGVGEFQLAGLLYLGAAIGVLPGVLKNFTVPASFSRKINNSLTIKQILMLTGVVVSGGMIAPLLLLVGLKLAQASSVAIWLNFELVATAVLGVLFFKEHLGKNGWIGVFFTILAGILMAFSEGRSGFASAVFIMLACFSWGIDNHLTSIIDCITPSSVTFIKGLFAGAVNLIIGLVFFYSHINLTTVMAALLVGALSYGISILLYVKSAQNIGATRSQVLFSTAPVFSIIISVIFLKETFTLIEFISIILIFLGVYFSSKVYHIHKHIHKPIEHIHMHLHEDAHHNHIHEKIDRKLTHTHSHVHVEIKHAHNHYPDVHHRHEHKDKSL
jgi:drug/metabolite transporter (DMT)-like permease